MATAFTEALGNHSPEAVAYQLFVVLSAIEGKKLYTPTQPGAGDHTDRAWVLDTYEECLKRVKKFG